MKTLDIENTYDLTNIKYKNISVWMLIRSQVELAQVINSTGYNMSFRHKNILLLLKDSLYGVINLFYFYKKSYWFFSNNDKRYLIDGKLKDRFFDDIADQIGQKKSIFIEYSMGKYSPINKSYSENIIGDLIFKLIARFFSLFVNPNRIKDLSVIDRVIKENELQLNLKKIIKVAVGEYYLYHLMIKLFKPEKIFLICYYSKIPLIIAAKDNKVETVEYQHGIISKDCAFYNSPYNFLNRYFPDTLLTMGTNLVENRPINFVFDGKRIIPKGNFYLDYVLYNFTNNKLDIIKQQFEKVVCVTSSGAHQNYLMDFINELSIKHPNYLFIIRPKHKENLDGFLSKTIILLSEFDIYQILKYSDFNITIQSFVAYEADYYGVYNILLNIDGLARLYFDNDIYGEFVEPENSNSFKIPNVEEITYNKKKRYFVNYKLNIDKY